jgi:hypothetical protein
MLFGAGTTAAFPDAEGLVRSALTPESGEVVFESPLHGIVIAQLGDRRSLPSTIGDTVTLTLEPTSRIEGKVELRGAPANRTTVAVVDARVPATSRYELVAPVKPDGSFVLEGVPRAKVRLFASVVGLTSRSFATKSLTLTTPLLTGIEIAVADGTRPVDIIVRSTVDVAADAAQVWLVQGSAKSTSLEKFDFNRATTTRFAKRPKDRATPTLKPGDLVADVKAPAVAISACAVGLPAQVDDPDLERKIRDNLAKVEVRCVPVPLEAASVIIEVPPWPRLD